MDFSEKYIKMCEEAKEIQEGWKIKEGDTIARVWWNRVWYREVIGFASLTFGDTWCRVVPSTYEFPVNNLQPAEGYKDFIWLPRQDQLQEMVKDDTKPLRAQYIYLLGDFVAWWKNEISEKYAIKFLTFEQMWLAFVMWKKYGKIWDEEKEEWVSLHEKNKGGK